MLWKASDLSDQKGFMLVETLVALVVAGLFLSALSLALSDAWRATRVAGDVSQAIILARNAVLELPADALHEAIAPGFSLTRSSGTIDVIVESDDVARAPSKTAGRPPEPHATPASMQLGEPKALMAAANVRPHLDLQLISIVVRTPMGRRVRLDSIGFADAAK
jgi:hypothetical protein